MVEFPPRPIAWIEIAETEFEQLRRISGILVAAENADLSFQVAGKIESIDVNLGDTVTKGQVLAELDQSSYELSSRASEGQLQEARARLTEARNEYNRQQDLFSKGWVAKASLDNAQAALDTAQSSVDIAQAQLELSQKDLTDTALRAPYDGKISSRLAEPSQQITAGQTVLIIEGKEGLEVSATVPETLIGKLQQNQSYAVRFPALPGLALNGRITEIGTQATQANAFPVTLLLADADDRLRAGMSAEIDFKFLGEGRTGRSGKAFRVPPTALLAGEDGNAYVFIYDAEAKTVRRQAVQTENVLNNQVLVGKGLKEGDVIATAGVEYLHDGQKVTLLGVGPKVFN
ncbi:efflux RND transporter periplasmic adaptor subunit [Kiloniella sp. b19]|uniref:efflux RND transporter periplasmic adaptor subunit n=1 Tax=Kiloniella sp. GXU_MW_B19 TaxID=3141326 RepID=UPI0031DE5F51